MADSGFGGLRVLALESRRSREIATLIRNNGGVPTVVPVMREVPLESNTEAFSFAESLFAGQFDLVLLLTGAGARILFEAIETRIPRERLAAALRRVQIATRGPKPVAVLRDWGLTAQIVSPEPSTWREVLASLDASFGSALAGMRIAVQEYGAPNDPLVAGLEERGVQLTRIPVYQWALPEDLTEMNHLIGAIENAEFDVVLFLTGTQSVHLCEVAASLGKRAALLNSLQRMAVISIGPSTTAELIRQGIEPDFHPSHPKMGIMVREAAEASARILNQK